MYPTGPYQTQHWDAVLTVAERHPHLLRLVRNYRASGHPGCLNAIMVNSDACADVWRAYWTGRID